MVKQTPLEFAVDTIKKAIQEGQLEVSLAYLGLTELPTEISLLTNVYTLNLSNNKLSQLPDELWKLTNLVNLDIGRNQIVDLSYNIGKLDHLKSLKLYGNEIYILPRTIGNLYQLEYLDLNHNKLIDLPSDIKKLSNLKELDLRANPIPVPVEILDKRDDPIAIINYCEKTGTLIGIIHEKIGDTIELIIEGLNVRKIKEVKLLVVGQGSVGKTSLIQQVNKKQFDEKEKKTNGIDIYRWIAKLSSKRKELEAYLPDKIWSEFIGDVTVKMPLEELFINVWDFGGQEIMHATHQFFLTKRSLYLLVLDSRLTQEENRVEYWLKIIQSFGGESPVLIVGNKIDQHPLDIDRTGLQKKYPNIVGILETSAATGAGIEALKAAIAEQVNNLPHVRDLLPETWFTVKTKLEELGKQSNFITQEKYLDLCAENEVSDETSQRTLIGFLHDLGVVLHFQDDPRLEALGILNPQWVTNGVYKILNSHALFQNKGVLSTSMLDEILNLPEYPRGKRLFIVDMMKKFELCYDIEPDKTFLVPDLLPKDEPAELKFNGVPAFEYAYPVLPSSVITRFIVRMNQKIDDGFVWRTGVVLKIGENTALVKADIEDRKITIAIDGLEHTRRDALSAIRYQLDEIHNSIKGLDAQKRVPIPEAPNAEPLEYDYLLMLEREGDETCRVKDGSRLLTINVRQILSAIESENQRKESGSRVTNIYIGGDVKDSNILAGDENEVKK